MATPLSPRGTAPAAGEVWLYEKKNYQGAVFKIRGSVSNMQEKHSAPEYLGSVKVGHDSFVEVFNHTGYKGKSARFEHDTENILKEHDHKIASVRAYEKGKEPPPQSPRGGAKPEEKH